MKFIAFSLTILMGYYKLTDPSVIHNIPWVQIFYPVYIYWIFLLFWKPLKYILVGWDKSIRKG